MHGAKYVGDLAGMFYGNNLDTTFPEIAESVTYSMPCLDHSGTTMPSLGASSLYGGDLFSARTLVPLTSCRWTCESRRRAGSLPVRALSLRPLTCEPPVATPDVLSGDPGVPADEPDWSELRALSGR